MVGSFENSFRILELRNNPEFLKSISFVFMIRSYLKHLFAHAHLHGALGYPIRARKLSAIDKRS